MGTQGKRVLHRRRQYEPYRTVADDRGCEVRPRCLECDLPMCIEDMGPAERYVTIREALGETRKCGLALCSNEVPNYGNRAYCDEHSDKRWRDRAYKDRRRARK